MCHQTSQQKRSFRGRGREAEGARAAGESEAELQKALNGMQRKGKKKPEGEKAPSSVLLPLAHPHLFPSTPFLHHILFLLFLRFTRYALFFLTLFIISLYFVSSTLFLHLCTSAPHPTNPLRLSTAAMSCLAISMRPIMTTAAGMYRRRSLAAPGPLCRPRAVCAAFYHINHTLFAYKCH